MKTRLNSNESNQLKKHPSRTLFVILLSMGRKGRDQKLVVIIAYKKQGSVFVLPF
jgi:hypothetical protein